MRCAKDAVHRKRPGSGDRFRFHAAGRSIRPEDRCGLASGRKGPSGPAGCIPECADASCAGGVRESEAFGHLVGQSLARGGEYPETRLLACGPRTNPWFQESSDRAMQSGELLSFDTDLIGPMGFYNDISRSWVIGERRPTRAQATLLDISRAQIDHNIDLLRPGVSFVELASKAYRLPDACLPNRYAGLVHGCGLGVEYPFVLYPEDADDGMYDGRFEANMIVCVESYVGELDGPDGVKLEQPILITDRGPEVLSGLPLDAADF